MDEQSAKNVGKKVRFSGPCEGEDSEMVSDHSFEVQIDGNLLLHRLEHLDSPDSRVLVGITRRRFGVEAKLCKYPLIVHVTNHVTVENLRFGRNYRIGEALLVLGLAISVENQIVV